MKLYKWLKDLWTGTWCDGVDFVFNEWGVWPLPVIGFLRGGWYFGWHGLDGGFHWRHSFEDSAEPNSGVSYPGEEGGVDI